ncbi:MAG: transcriptional repressor LexA [Spirochaetota bacterium]
MKGLTKRQIEVVQFIQEYISDSTYPPTIREIAGRFDISVKAAFDHIKALEKKGIIKSSSNKSRSLEIVDQEYSPNVELVNVPLLGSIAAGTPLLAEENLERTLQITADMLGSGTYFALHVQGDSMVEAGICDGDIAVIRQSPEAENGEIVVARIAEESVTLKRYFKEHNRIRLQPENQSYQPIYTQDMRILGKLHMIIRNYD